MSSLPRPLPPPFLLAVILLLGSAFAKTASAQDGIAFGKSLAEARKTAELTGKPILLDAMTSWCAPCRQMERDVFTNAALATYVGDRLIPVQLDMERSEGPAAGDRYAVRAYPTILVLAPNGDEIDRIIGYRDLTQFTEWLSSLDLSASKAPEGSYADLAARFESGVRDTSVLRKLVAFGEQGDLPQTTDYVYAYLQARNDFSSPEARALVLRHASANSPLLDVLVARQEEYAAAEGDYAVGDALARAVDEGLFGVQTARPRQAKKLIRRTYPQAADSTYYRYQMRRAREAGKARRFGRYAIKWQGKYPSNDPGELAELIYVFDLQLPGYKEEEVAKWRKREQELLELEGR